MANKKKDILVPLLILSDEKFKKYNENLITIFKQKEKSQEELELNIDKKLGITLNTIVTKEIKPQTDLFDPIEIIDGKDPIDREYFSEQIFRRTISKSKNPIKITFDNENIYEFHLYINSMRLRKKELRGL